MRCCYIFLVVSLIDHATSKIFEKCELAQLLERKHGFPREEVKKWVCTAQYESTFNSAATNHYNWDQSKDYGLFQLNNRYWCGDESGQNVCNIPCSALLDDDLTDDLKCARRIVKDTQRWMKVKDGMVAWVAYKNRCMYRDLDEYMLECWGPDAQSPISENIIPPRDTVIDTEKEPTVGEEEATEAEKVQDEVAEIQKMSTTQKTPSSTQQITTTTHKKLPTIPKVPAIVIPKTPSRASGLGQSLKRVGKRRPTIQTIQKNEAAAPTAAKRKIKLVNFG